LKKASCVHVIDTIGLFFTSIYFVSFIHPTTPKEAVVKMCRITMDEAEYFQRNGAAVVLVCLPNSSISCQCLLTIFHLVKKQSFRSPNAVQGPEIVGSKCHR
jgi:hypothetical protein